MHYARGFITDTHVRSAVVVEVDVALYHARGTLDGLEQPLPIEAFHFNYPIDTFRHGIVRGLVVFRHADGNAMPPKALHVRVATILHATVRVVYQALQIFTPSSSQRPGLWPAATPQAWLRHASYQPVPIPLSYGNKHP